MLNKVLIFGVACVAAATIAAAQTAPSQSTTPQTAAAQAPAQPSRPASGKAQVAIEVGGQYVKTERGERYQGGKWIDISYGAPIKRGRADLWGSGAEYGKKVLAGAPVWRAGANVSTRLKTEVPLVIGGKTVAPGEYSLFIDLKSPTEWTLIVSSWGAKPAGNDKTPGALWGAYDYTPDKDVARVAMKVGKLQMSIETLAWNFSDVTATGGNLLILWDTVAASAPFTFGK
jgi:hypothetical protein